MNKIHSIFADEYYEISIMLKSQMLCDVLRKYKKALTANLEITITDDVFTFIDNDCYAEAPYLPIVIVKSLLDQIQVWQDCSYISVEDAESLTRELSDNALELSNSVSEMKWKVTNYTYFRDELSVESAVIKNCEFIYKEQYSNSRNTWNSDGLTGDRKTVYEYVVKNIYWEADSASVLYKKYADSSSTHSYYQGDQFKNAMLKLTEDEFVAILESLVEDGYLGRKSDGVHMGYCKPEHVDGKIKMTIRVNGEVVDESEI